MSLTTHIKPNAAKIAEELKKDGEAYIITQNGKAAMVVQSVAEYEKTQETLAMLKLITQSDKDIEQGNVHDAKTVLAKFRNRRGL